MKNLQALKKDLWLILAAASLLGMILLPKSAYSARFETPAAVDLQAPLSVAAPLPLSLPSAIAPLSPVSLPAQPVAIPSIGGPLTRLPSPKIGVPTLPGAVVRLSTFAAAKKTFADKDGREPSQEKLDAAFDNAKAEKAEAGDDAPVQVESKRRKRQDPTLLTLPEYDLLTEIGIPR